MLLTLAFWRSVWRTFYIQAVWNFERMQNLGFLYAMLPVLRHLARGERELIDSVRRHGQFFNTHPYFASTIIGAVAKLEEDARSGDENVLRSMNALKVGLMGSLGAIGDSLFWAALRPLAAWLAVIAASLGHPVGGALLFLVVYNVPHVVVRYGGGAIGYAAGIDVVRQLRRVDFPHVAQRLKGAAIAAAFAALPLLAYHAADGRALRAGAVLAAVAFFTVISKGVSGTKLAAALLAAVLLGTWLWNALGGP